MAPQNSIREALGKLYIGLFSPLAWKAILPIFGNPSILKGRDSEGLYSAKGNNAIFFEHFQHKKTISYTHYLAPRL